MGIAFFEGKKNRQDRKDKGILKPRCGKRYLGSDSDQEKARTEIRRMRYRIAD